jgi:FkbM family methyltransferase
MISSLLDFYSKLIRERLYERTITSRLLRLLPSIPLKSRYGVWLYSDSKDATNMFSILGDYDDVFEVVSTLRPGMAFIDIGANAGIFSIVADKLIGDEGVIVAFEPSYASFKKLIANASLNHLSNFFPFMAAIGASFGVEHFSFKSSHTGMSHLDPDGDTRVAQFGGVELSLLLSSIIEHRKTMIKIDVEGAELAVIQSIESLIDSAFVETVIVEIDSQQQSRFDVAPSEIYAFMHKKGYVARHGIDFSAHFNETFERQASRTS